MSMSNAQTAEFPVHLPGMGSQQEYLVVGVQTVSLLAVAGSPYDEQHQDLL